jgi:hypothetical protein
MTKTALWEAHASTYANPAIRDDPAVELPEAVIETLGRIAFTFAVPEGKNVC